MATSRTGTAKWKNLRARVIREERDAGVTCCPLCHRPLAWGTAKRPDSPEVDHITPKEHGGKDLRENLRVICRDCNGKRRSREARVVKPRSDPLRLSRAW